MLRIPKDRSRSQPIRAWCANPLCAERADKRLEWNVTGDLVQCPKCKASRSPYVGIYVLIHLLVPADDGPIAGSGGRRWAIACDPTRAHLATGTNQEAATDDPEAANCPGCLRVAEDRGIASPSGILLSE